MLGARSARDHSSWGLWTIAGAAGDPDRSAQLSSAQRIVLLDESRRGGSFSEHPAANCALDQDGDVVTDRPARIRRVLSIDDLLDVRTPDRREPPLEPLNDLLGNSVVGRPFLTSASEQDHCDDDHQDDGEHRERDVDSAAAERPFLE